MQPYLRGVQTSPILWSGVPSFASGGHNVLKLLGPCFVPGSSTAQTNFFPNAEERWLADHPQLFGDTGEKGGVI